MYDLITIGGISIDMYYQGNSLTQKGERFNLAVGGKYLVDSFFSGLGGGAANVAIGTQAAGFKTALLAKIGENQFEELIRNHLKDHKLTDALIQKEKEYMKISSILLSPEGERTIIHYETPHEHILRTDKDLESLENTRMVYMANLWRVPLDERRRILSHLHQKKIITAVNLGIADCRRDLIQLKGLLHHVEILLVNTHEFAELVKKPFDSLKFKEDVTEHFDFLKNKIVVVTDGKNGSYAYSEGNVFFESVHRVEKIVDTTGAGDAYSAGFLAGYLENKNIQHAMNLGSKLAAKVIQKIGAN